MTFSRTLKGLGNHVLSDLCETNKNVISDLYNNYGINGQNINLKKCFSDVCDNNSKVKFLNGFGNSWSRLCTHAVWEKLCKSR